MKKLTLSLFILCSLFITTTFAQSKMQVAKMKQRIMTGLKINSVEADSIVNIVEEFYTNARALKGDESMNVDERKTALQKNRKGEMVKLRTHLDADQIKKLQDIVEEMKQERKHQKGAKDSTVISH